MIRVVNYFILFCLKRTKTNNVVNNVGFHGDAKFLVTVVQREVKGTIEEMKRRSLIIEHEHPGKFS